VNYPFKTLQAKVLLNENLRGEKNSKTLEVRVSCSQSQIKARFR